MTDIDKLIHDLRQPGGDDARDRELSDRFAVALGWVFHPLALGGGECTLPFWTEPNGERAWGGPPLFTSDLTAIVGTGLRDKAWGLSSNTYSKISNARYEPSAQIEGLSPVSAPTPERALMIARLTLKQETGG